MIKVADKTGHFNPEILIVEDSPTQAAQIKHLLEANNYRIEVVQDGSKALLWLSDHKPSLIVSDILMPGMNGFDLCEKIKSDKRTEDIPVILLTSLSDTEEVIKGLIARADSFLTKPYDAGHLLSNIKKTLDESFEKAPHKEDKGIEINYRGRKRVISTVPQKVIKLLLNIYQGAIYQNERLIQAQEELKNLNDRLESLVQERTSALAEEIEMNRKITDQIREGETKYRTIVETANEGIWKVDADLTTTFVNGKMAEMLGYSPAEMIGHSAFEFMDEEGKTQSLKNLQSHRRGIKGSYEHKYIRKDGASIITYANVTPLQDSKGTFAGSIGLLTDITERKKVENALKDSREKLNLALENGKIGIWEWDLNSNELFWDQRMAMMFGLQPGKIIKSTKEFENLVHKEDRLKVRKVVAESIQRGLPCETIFRTKPWKGKVKYLSLKALVIKDNNDNPVRATGVCFDVTKLQEDSEQIIELNKKLLQSNKELENFAYVASHDLQEPLRMVTSFTQLLELQYGDKLDQRAGEYIHYAVEGAKRMYNLLNGLLSYSRIQRKGKMFTRVDLNHVLDNVLSTLAIQINEKNPIISFDKLPVILADENQMNQLFQNLISNSIKFSNETPKIHISSITQKDKYVFSVRDEGMGIEPQYFDKIFKIFQRLLPRDQFEGTGIGLSICKSIVERHDGKIWVESEPGKGSTFFFTIPSKFFLQK